MLNFHPLFTADVQVAEPLVLGPTPAGERRVIPILGGRVEGERLNAEVLAGGFDWQVVHDDGAVALHARYTLRAVDGTLVQVDSRGLRHGPPGVLERIARGENVDPSEYFFRTVLRFETAVGPLGWLNRTIAVANAVRSRHGVRLEAFELL